MTPGQMARTHRPVKIALLLAAGVVLVSGCAAAGSTPPSKVSTAPVVHSRAVTDAPANAVPTDPCADPAAVEACAAPPAPAPVPSPAPVAVDAPDQALPGVDLPVVTVRAVSDGTASESDDRPCSNISAASLGRGELEIRRTGAVDVPLTVRYTTTGTATSGGDYEALPDEITIPAGAATASVLVTPSGGHAPAPLHLHQSRSVVLTLVAASTYDVGNPSAEIALHFDFDVFGCAPPVPDPAS